MKSINSRLQKKQKLNFFVPYLLLLVPTIMVTSCGGCNDRTSSARNIVALQNGPQSSGTETATQTQTQTSTETSGNIPSTEKNEDIGEEIPPIQNTEITTIDTTGGGGLKHLILEAGDNMDLGRYLSEYFIVIRAKEASCVKLRFRPSSGINNEVSDDAITPENAQSGPCEGTRVAGEKAPSTATKTSTGTSTGTATAFHLQFVDDTKQTAAKNTNEELMLAGKSLAICSSRIFRMKNRGITGNQLEKVSTKTGRLAVVQGSIRIWVDEEVTNFCTGGISLDGRSATPFGALIQEGYVNSTWADKLWLQHLQNLGVEVERIYKRMTGQFGPLSDIDQNESVEIFISPDINRSEFILYKTSAIDHFRVLPRFKIEDLALYNSQSNPSSNEGEILYLWAPDPAGIYNQVQFPSSNSLTTNYAKGYLAFQLFNIIYANEKLFQQKRKKIDEPWLMESLSLLASAYYAGNDFTVLNLSQYLTSRPQYISLSMNLDTSLVSPEYLPMAQDEQVGIRTLFGWYLHTRLCGTAPTPCGKIKDLITSAKSNYEVLEQVIGTPFDQITTNFAASVAIGLLDSPDQALAAFEKSSAKEPKPYLMGNLAEIFESEPPVTAETENPSPAQLLAVDPRDRTVAGPFPSRQMLFAQPVSPEAGVEFKLAKDSLVVLHATGLLEKRSEITAMFGEGLKVIFVPIGDRDLSKRRIHFEKLSQDAHGDLRPENLTTLQDNNRSYLFDKTYDSANFSVNTKKQLWVLGSIDNYKVNIGGSSTEIQDTDAYNIEFRPCAAAADVTACENAGGTYDAVVQVVIKDFEKELAPMLLVTSTDRQIFRGRSVLGRMSDMLNSWEEAQDITKSFQCPGAKFNRTMTVTPTAPGTFTTSSAHGLTQNQDVLISSLNGLTAPGLVPYRTYKAVVTSTTTFTLQYSGAAVTIGAPASDTYYLHTSSANQCASGGVLGLAYYTHEATKSNNQAFAHTYDNYLMMGMLGYPFNNYRTITYTGAQCEGSFCYKAAESARQHYNFVLNKDLTPKNYRVYTANPHYRNPGNTAVPLTFNEVTTLLMLKKEMDSPTCTASRTTDQAFLEECASVAELTTAQCSQFCAKDNNHTAMDNAITSYIVSKNLSLVCYPGMNCDDVALLLGKGYPPDANFPTRHSSQWVSPKYYNEYKASAFQQDSLYYKPIEPQFGSNSYCTGDPGTSTTQIRECRVRDDSLPVITDIREQFNTTPSRISFNCSSKIPTADFDLCIDTISRHREFEPTEPYLFVFNGQTTPTDRARQRRSLIHYRAGELLSKPERLQHILFQIPATGGVAQVIVGGRKKSQGKYLLRARLVDFDL